MTSNSRGHCGGGILVTSSSLGHCGGGGSRGGGILVRAPMGSGGRWLFIADATSASPIRFSVPPPIHPAVPDTAPMMASMLNPGFTMMFGVRFTGGSDGALPANGQTGIPACRGGGASSKLRGGAVAAIGKYCSSERSQVVEFDVVATGSDCATGATVSVTVSGAGATGARGAGAGTGGGAVTPAASLRRSAAVGSSSDSLLTVHTSVAIVATETAVDTPARIFQGSAFLRAGTEIGSVSSISRVTLSMCALIVGATSVAPRAGRRPIG